MPSYANLKTELDGKPYAGLADADAAALLNQPGAPVQGPVPLPIVLIWAANNNVLPSLNSTAAVAGPFQGVAQAALLLLQGSATELDTAIPDVQRMLGALAQGGIITAAARTALLALGQTPGPSRAQLTFGVPVSDQDVAAARGLK